jgi:hypothetical protein
VASASNGSAIRRLNGAGNLRRSDSIRNRLQPRPKVPNYGGPKVGIAGAVRSNFVLKARLPGTDGLSDQFSRCAARRIGRFGLRRGGARARRRRFDALVGSRLDTSITPTAPMLFSSAEPHWSRIDPKFAAGGLRIGVSTSRAAPMIPIRFSSG